MTPVKAIRVRVGFCKKNRKQNSFASLISFGFFQSALVWKLISDETSRLDGVVGTIGRHLWAMVNTSGCYIWPTLVGKLSFQFII